MKKLFYVFLVALTLASCNTDDELLLPIIDSAGTQDVTFIDGKATVTVGEPITLTVVCSNVEISRYEWIVNDVVKGSDDEFIFTPMERGLYNISVKIYNADDKFDERAIGKFLAIDPAAVLTVYGDGEALEGVTNIDVADGETVTISFSIDNEVETNGYEVKVNGEEVELDNETYSIGLTWSGSYKIEVSVTNLDDIETTADYTINVNGPYKEGLIFYGAATEDLAFYNPVTSTFDPGNLFNTVNGENIAGNGGILDLFIDNSKIYFLNPYPVDVYDKSQITIADAQTYKVQKKLQIEPQVALGMASNLMVVNENKFYIGYLKYDVIDETPTYIGGIRVLTLGSDDVVTPAAADIEGASGVEGVAAPLWSRMLRHGKYVLAGCWNKVVVIDTDTDQVSKTIAFDENRQVLDIVKGRNGKIYVVVSGEVDKTAANWTTAPTYTSAGLVATIDPASWTKTAETELRDNDNEVYPRGGRTGCFAVASLTSDEIFFIDKGTTTTAPHPIFGFDVTTTTLDNVYKYNYTTQETSLFVKLDETQVENGITGYMATDKNGVLYVPTVSNNTGNSTVWAFDISSGNSLPAPASSRISGQAGVTSTYRFE